MALISRLPSGGGASAASRSTKIHNVSERCTNDVETKIFDFTGGGKVNRVELVGNVNFGSNAYISFVVDGVELYRLSGGLSSNPYYLFRNNRGVLVLSNTDFTSTLPLDIEFKNNFTIIAYATNNGPLVTASIEIAEN